MIEIGRKVGKTKNPQWRGEVKALVKEGKSYVVWWDIPPNKVTIEKVEDLYERDLTVTESVKVEPGEKHVFGKLRQIRDLKWLDDDDDDDDFYF